MRTILIDERLAVLEGMSTSCGSSDNSYLPLAWNPMTVLEEQRSISEEDVEARDIERRTFLGRFGAAAGLVGMAGFSQACGGAASDSDGEASSDTDAAVSSDSDQAAGSDSDNSDATEAESSDSDSSDTEASDSDSSDTEASDSDSSDTEASDSDSSDSDSGW